MSLCCDLDLLRALLPHNWASAYPTIPNVFVDSSRASSLLLPTLLLPSHSIVLELEDVVSP